MEFIIFIAVVLIFVIIMGLMHNWTEMREKRLDAQLRILALKEKMVERGMSAEEIRQVIEAGLEGFEEWLADPSFAPPASLSSPRPRKFNADPNSSSMIPAGK